MTVWKWWHISICMTSTLLFNLACQGVIMPSLIHGDITFLPQCTAAARAHHCTTGWRLVSHRPGSADLAACPQGHAERQRDYCSPNYFDLYPLLSVSLFLALIIAGKEIHQGARSCLSIGCCLFPSSLHKRWHLFREYSLCSGEPLWRQASFCISAWCSQRWEAVEGGGASGPTLRHDRCCNGLLALPCVVEFAAERHSSISALRSEALGWLSTAVTAAVSVWRSRLFF